MSNSTEATRLNSSWNMLTVTLFMLKYSTLSHLNSSISSWSMISMLMMVLMLEVWSLTLVYWFWLTLGSCTTHSTALVTGLLRTVTTLITQCPGLTLVTVQGLLHNTAATISAASQVLSNNHSSPVLSNNSLSNKVSFIIIAIPGMIICH